MNNLRKSAGPTIKIIDSKIYPYEQHMLQERARAAEDSAADDFITAAGRLVKVVWLYFAFRNQASKVAVINPLKPTGHSMETLKNYTQSPKNNASTFYHCFFGVFILGFNALQWVYIWDTDTYIKT